MARVVVTGGAGFIGSHLTEYLLGGGDSVSVIDDFSTGTITNLEKVIDEPRLSVTEGSVADAGIVDDLIKSCDEVYHLAATVGVDRVLENPIRGFSNNVAGTENVHDPNVAHLAATQRIVCVCNVMAEQAHVLKVLRFATEARPIVALAR